MYVFESKILDNNHILTSFAININTRSDKHIFCFAFTPVDCLYCHPTT